MKEIVNSLSRLFPFLAKSKTSFLSTPGRLHFINGIFLERGRVPNSIYAWAVEAPFWTGLPYLELNYSYRLNDGLTIRGTQDEIIRQIAKCVQNDDRLQRSFIKEISPIEFYGKFLGDDLRDCKVPTTRFDLGACCLLNGTIPEAARHFSCYIAASPDFLKPSNVDLAKRILSSITQNDHQFSSLLEERERQTAKMLEVKRINAR